MARLLFQGHGSYRIQSDAGEVIYVDPFAGEGYDLPADLVLVSHEHFDHNHIDLVTLKSGGKVYRSSDLLSGGRYRSITCGTVRVEATPACNRNHPLDRCVGFLISVDGLRIYGAGDTSKTDFMAQRLAKEKIDYALLPIDGIYNMGPGEASECAKIIGARHSIPVHMKPGVLFDVKMAGKFQCSGRLILKPGMEVCL